MLKQRLDYFHLKTKFETVDIIPKMLRPKNCLKQRLDLPFENKIETMDSLAKMHGQKK